MAILDEIVKYKRGELEARMRKRPLERLRKETAKLRERKPIFIKMLRRSKKMAVIAEIKKRSPSKGILRKDFKPIAIARAYEKSGADALSILTDENFFGGSAAIFTKIRAATKLPLLRKDFMIHEYQIYEARLMGADAVLLIADILSSQELRSLGALAESLGLDALFEVHTSRDIDKVLPLKPKMVGINNRDLRTFQVDLNVTKRLIRKLPRTALVVSESGIQTAEDLIYLKRLGVRAALVGESLMREKDPGLALINIRKGA